MPEYKCICGAVLAGGAQKANHCRRCPQWKEYLRTVIADPGFLLLKRERGLDAAAKQFGFTGTTLRAGHWKELLQREEAAFFQRQEKGPPPSSPRPPYHTVKRNGGHVVSLTASGILNAIRALINEHELCPRRIAELEARVKELERENEHLRISLSQSNKALEKLREAELEPIKVRIHAEALNQARDR